MQELLAYGSAGKFLSRTRLPNSLHSSEYFLQPELEDKGTDVCIWRQFWTDVGSFILPGIGNFNCQEEQSRIDRRSSRGNVLCTKEMVPIDPRAFFFTNKVKRIFALFDLHNTTTSL